MIQKEGVSCWLRQDQTASASVGFLSFGLSAAPWGRFCRRVPGGSRAVGDLLLSPGAGAHTDEHEIDLILFPSVYILRRTVLNENGFEKRNGVLQQAVMTLPPSHGVNPISS
jgi:hypothetical protein